ncbi:hypothetical protein [Demequina flava]|uniref:hypothetical protein n=1 Tax=Demequina flava TaxID=1095025 RepID=UPI000784B107|nr:hypothetical protein [Demequina flava]
MSDNETSEEFRRGQEAERARFAEYLQSYEAGSRKLAEQAETEDSRVYQTTIANAMNAMRRAITGEFHWQDGWKK